MNMLKSLATLVIIAIILSSCENNSYYAVIDYEPATGLSTHTGITTKEIEIIASNDTEAYEGAVLKYLTRCKVYDDTPQKDYLDKPIGFKLFHKKRGDITFEIPNDFRNEAYSRYHSLVYKTDGNALQSTNEPARTIDSVTIAKLSPKMRVKIDEFDVNKAKVYEHKTSPQYVNRNGFYCYFKLVNNEPMTPWLSIQYYNDNWLFIKSYVVLVDDTPYQLIPDDVDRDSGNGGYIWEWSQFRVEGQTKSIIDAIMSGTTVKIKFNGSEYYDTRTLTKSEIQAIKDVVELYRAYGGVW